MTAYEQLTERKWLQSQLLGWFADNQRSMPWRSPSVTGYQVWVSEIMLQQTRVEVVRDYYRKFMGRFPTLEALAKAPIDDVLHHWQGLGYYSRARRLHAGAQFILTEYPGSFPQSVDELLTVPGIGPYSAGAISSIAFGHAAPIVDGNVIRVLTRVLGLRGDPTRAPLKNLLWNNAATMVSELAPGEPSQLNPALMELGALVCTPRTPGCNHCPWSLKCVALDSGLTQTLPELPPKKKKEPVELLLIVAKSRGRYGVVQYPSDSRWWAGLTGFAYCRPEVITSTSGGALDKEGVHYAEQAQQFAVSTFGSGLKSSEALPSFSHVITKYAIRVHPFLVEITKPNAQGPLASLVIERSRKRVRISDKTELEPPSAENTSKGENRQPQLSWVQQFEALAMPAPHRKLVLTLP